MVQLQAPGWRQKVAVGLILSAMVVAGIWHPAAATHTSEVTAVEGVAFNYYTDVSLFGGPSMRRGYGQVVCTAPNTPTGCVPADQQATADSPSVECPEGGGTDSATDPDGARAVYGPAVIFGGQWPEGTASAPPSGPLTSSIDCQLGEGGYVTASTSVTLPRGVGPGPVVADEVHSTCTANESGITGSTRIVNGILETSYDPQTQEPATTESIPENPPPNYTREGTIDHVGDSYRVVFNEQITNPDGSLTVNAVHMYLLGPTAVGDMVIGSVTCGPLTTAPVEHTTTTTDATTTSTTDATTTSTTDATTTSTTEATTTSTTEATTTSTTEATTTSTTDATTTSTTEATTSTSTAPPSRCDNPNGFVSGLIQELYQRLGVPALARVARLLCQLGL